MWVGRGSGQCTDPHNVQDSSVGATVPSAFKALANPTMFNVQGDKIGEYSRLHDARNLLTSSAFCRLHVFR